MSRVQLAINVEELDPAIEFYSKLFATEPAKVRSGYANFAIAEPPLKLVLIETPGQGGTLNHLGVEVASTDEVVAAQARLAGEGLTTASEEGVACCYARQDKVWVDGPSGEPWEIYTVLEDVEMLGGQLPRRRSRDRRHLLLRDGRRCARAGHRRPLLLTRHAVSDLAHQPETGTGPLQLDLARRLLAEALGTGLLVMAVVGSGIMASRLSPDDIGLQLLENAAATAGALVALIWMLGSVSGAHFNPVVTLVDRAFGDISNRDTGCYITAQIAGGCLGAMIANLMFELPAVDPSTTVRSSGALWLSEAVATAGLLLVIHGCVRSGRSNVVAVAVGVWIGGAYFFTSSTSFANPAVTIARTLSDTFAGIAPSSVPMFIVMQLVGAAAAYALVRVLFPRPHASRP